jgi:hypothetical protein
MSQTYLPPPAPVRKPEARRGRGFVPPLFQDPETRSIEVGVAGTILVHLLLLLFIVPQLMKSPPTKPYVRKQAPPRPFSIQLQPLPKPPPPPPQPNKFVEANPNANNKIPDRTTNFAAQNQTVAQEKPTPNGKSDMPTLEGRKDIKSTQIVSGTLTKQQEQAPVPQSKVAPPKAAVTPPKQAQNPLAGTDKAQGTNPDTFGTARAKVDDNAKPILEKVDGADAPQVANASGTAPRIDPRHPQPRKVLQPQVRPAVFTENKFGTSNIGPTAVDARWNNYGEYLQRLIESVQIEWDKILETGRTYPPGGTTVTVTFRLDSKGRVAAILDHTSTSSEQGLQACMAAITNRSPYGEWTADMIALLGESQDMTFTFFYQ